MIWAMCLYKLINHRLTAVVHIGYVTNSSIRNSFNEIDICQLMDL